MTYEEELRFKRQKVEDALRRIGGWDGTEADFDADMEVMAWTVWKKFAADLSLTVPKRAMPERVAAILAERKG